MKRRRYVIIMAAGSGTRMGASLPKQFLEIGGKAILQHTIEAFLEASPGISVVTVLNPDYIDYWRNYCLKHNFTCPQITVAGGITRFHSVRNALDRIRDGAVVAVHDGVRPLVTAALISEMFEKSESVPALIPVIPCVDTLKVLRKEGDELKTVEGAVADRSVLYSAQTPQIFHSELLKSAYSLAYDTSFTDDASVLQKYGKSLSYVMGERLNIKITTQEDLLLARAVMSLREKV
jgi:2-C-methyl-D-erythritol 4-phosphate cytidylyltransferase